MSDTPTCPKCGEQMVWKHQPYAARCFACGDYSVSGGDGAWNLIGPTPPSPEPPREREGETRKWRILAAAMHGQAWHGGDLYMEDGEMSCACGIDWLRWTPRQIESAIVRECGRRASLPPSAETREPERKWAECDEDCCNADDRGSYACSLIRGHAGDHEASDGTTTVHRWLSAPPAGSGETEEDILHAEESLARIVELATQALRGDPPSGDPEMWVTTIECHATVVRDGLAAHPAGPTRAEEGE